MTGFTLSTSGRVRATSGRVRAAALAFMAAALAATAAPAQEGAGMSIAEMAAVFESAGVEAEVESGAEPALYAQSGGFNFAVTAYNCDADGRCAEFLFSSFFDVETPTPLDVINDFNARTLAGRAFLDSDGAPNIEHLFTVSGPGDAEIAARNLMIWESVLREFAEHIGFFESAGS